MRWWKKHAWKLSAQVDADFLSTEQRLAEVGYFRPSPPIGKVTCPSDLALYAVLRVDGYLSGGGRG
jgi:hypothetical protein